eukprot:TRINITY_DN7578_c0_g1_i1.p1 TRINITY_DN7578_c0_g1~~TRINITY_DN7578_c0_g1_i1.p1  ORF type:complete len:197 (+),score=66.18 TRINITY_DN7578_c0_g1_i1:56-592(+)
MQRTAAVALLAVALCATPAMSKELHNNWIYFDSNATATVDFALDSYKVTSGQPYDGVHSEKEGVCIRAGRHKSTEVAAEFVYGITLASVLATEHFVDALPHELNFAVFGNLTITVANESVTCNNFRMAQGHYSTHNNWWMGGAECASVPTTGKMSCLCSKRNVEFHSESKSDRMFVLF